MRRSTGYLLAVLAACAVGCKDKADDKAATKAPAVIDLDKRCEQLGKTCGDSEKHVAKIVDECKQAAAKQRDKGCAAQVSASYDCMERELCGKADKVWALDDLRVLADRQSKCMAERTEVFGCVGK